MAEPIDLDAGLDELFATAPEGFVAAREALVRALKQTDRPDDASTVHALRRPTLAVWGINQMSRAEPDRVAELVAAGADVDDLQRGGSGTRDELRAAGRRRRELLDELTEVAAALAGRAEATRASIAATLDAASLDSSLQDDLLNGRLTAELAPAVRFLGDVEEAPTSARPRRTPARPTKATREKPKPVRDDLAVRRAAAALAEARDRAEAADDEMREAEAATREAEEALEAAHRQVAELDAALADARADVTAAKRAVTEANRGETRVRTAQRRAEAALRVAERNATDADR
jgi:chromosome segregation ATPase